MNRRSILAFLLILSWVLVIGQTAAAETTRTFVDSAGRKVDVPATIHRILAAGPPASVLLYALAPDKMLGWVRAPSAKDKAFIAKPYRDLPTLGRLTGKGNTASLETVLAMKPDLIVDVGTVDPTYASLADRVEKQTGIPYVLIDGRFADTPETLRTVGDLIGASEQADKLASYAERTIRRVQAIVATIPANKRPRVYYGRGPDGLETGLGGSINTEVLRSVGAVNVAHDAGTGHLAHVSLEQVLAWNPNVILSLDGRFAKSVMTDPQWATIEAVRNKRVFVAPTAPFGWFDSPPGINRLIGVAWLTDVLYPGKAHVDLRAETRQFYKLFYHFDLSEPQLDTLLAGSGTAH